MDVFRSKDHELAEYMIEFIIENKYFQQITWYRTWIEFHKYLFDKTMIRPNYLPEEYRKIFFYKFLPNLNTLNLTVENRNEFRRLDNTLHLERTQLGYKLKPSSNISEENDQIRMAICKTRQEFEYLSEPVILIDWQIFEELTSSLYLDVKKRFLLSLIVQTDEERFNRIEISVTEFIRRIINIIITYNQTAELPNVFNDLNFEDISKYQTTLKWVKNKIIRCSEVK